MFKNLVITFYPLGSGRGGYYGSPDYVGPDRFPDRGVRPGTDR